MAHGSPRYNICNKCCQYTLVSRFSQDPNCPTCGQKTEQTTKSDIQTNYWVGILDFITPNFGNWIKVEKRVKHM